MGDVFTVRVRGKRGVAQEITLPMNPYEMLDLLDRVGSTSEETPTGKIFGGRVSTETYALLVGEHSLYELNALAWKLAPMDDTQRIAFDGLVKMEIEKKEGPIALGKLIDLAYSVDCCDVHPGVASYEELGRFYVEQGLFPGLKAIPEENLPYLNYEKIGEKFSKEEGGVLVSGGYVLQTSDLKQAPQALDQKPHKPEYAILMEVAHAARIVQLPLPNAPQAMDAVLDIIGAKVWGDVSLRCLDCRAPALIPAIGGGENIAHINRLAGMLEHMDDKQLTKYKAVLDACQEYDLTAAVEIAETLDEYSFTPQCVSPKDMALDFLRSSMGDKAAEKFHPFVNLERYGKALMEEQGRVLIDYGMVFRKDGQCLNVSQNPCQTSLPAVATLGGM